MVDNIDREENTTSDVKPRWRVLVIGDIMLDKYRFVKTDRQAPEAKIPVWDEIREREDNRLGGAGNVANNLKRLAGPRVEVTLIGIAGYSIGLDVLSSNGVNTDLVIRNGPSMIKNRFVDLRTGKLLFRLDNIKHFLQEEVNFTSVVLSSHISRTDVDAVIISDYDKGTVTAAMVKRLKDLGVPIIVDSKRKDLTMFEGSHILKLNELEYSAQVSSLTYTNLESLFEQVIVTKGKDGAELRFNERAKSADTCLSGRSWKKETYVTHVEQFMIKPADVVDVTGCGDTHTAALTYSLLQYPTDVRKAIRFANECSRNVVQKFGTSLPD